MYKGDEKYGVGISGVQGIIRLGMSLRVEHLHNFYVLQPEGIASVSCA